MFYAFTFLIKLLVVIVLLQIFSASSVESFNIGNDTTINSILNLLSGDMQWTLITTLGKIYLFHNLPESARLCLDDLTTVTNSVFKMEEWALSMVDAFGKPRSGLFEGNTIYPGSYEECLKIKQGHISGRYCWYITPFMRQGMCIPDSCSYEIGNIASTIIKNTFEKLADKPIVIPGMYVVCVDSPLKDLPNDVITLIAIGLLSIITLLVIVATVMDLKIESQKKNKETQPNFKLKNKEDYTLMAIDSETTDKYRAKKNGHDEGFSLLFKMLLCFSAYKNSKKLFSLEHGKNSFRELHGLRASAMLVIIFGHSYNWFIQIADNTIQYVQFEGQLFYYFVRNYPIEIFFFITGFLTLHGILHKNFNKKMNIIRFSVSYVVERYWRLALIPGLYILLLQTGLEHYLGSGPFWGRMDKSCRKNWWRNLLFVSNWLRPKIQDESCTPQWWYMSVSMQLHVLSLVIVLPILKKKYRLSVYFGGIVLVSSWIYLFSVAYKYDLPPDASLLFQNTSTVMKYSRTYQLHFWSKINETPFFHSGSYFCGMLVSWLLFRTKYKIHFTKMQIVYGWITWFASVNLAMSFLYYEPNKFSKIVYEGLYTTVLGLCVGWVLLLCFTKNSGIVSSILGWKVWLPLSKLTLTVYMIHLDVIVFYYRSEHSRVHLSLGMLIAFFLRHWLVSYVIAIPISLFIEAPVESIINLVKRRPLSK